jgi:hypothetical protein
VTDTSTTARVIEEVTSGDGLTLAQAAKLLPGHRTGHPTNPSTVFRWVVKGAKGAAGAVVKLEAVRLGEKWVTSRAALGRFMSALTGTVPASALTGAPVDPLSSPSARRVAAAVAKLEAAGA